MRPKLLIIENEVDIRKQMKWALEQDYEILFAGDRQSAISTFREACPPVVTLDLGLPPNPHGVEEGLGTLQELLREDALAKVVVVTGQQGLEPALKAIGLGAYDFFRKPILVDELKILLRRALYIYQLEQEHRDWQRRQPEDSFEGMLGSSPPMQAVFESIRRVAKTDASVVISGESGTGKELVARAIHQRSSRRDGPFIAINCGAVPENLLESELFGHEKGAFTDAHAQRKGRIELAEGGTLFLDEVGELLPPLQVKLLRFLQDHQLERVGGLETISVDVRVLAATNIDLEQAILDGRFREDLHYRLGVVRIHLPPLRDRGEDLMLLAQALLRSFATKRRESLRGFDQGALLAMQTHRWPGNVRELENRIQRATIMAEGFQLTADDLELIKRKGQSGRTTLKEARETMEKDLIKQSLVRNNRNISRTAAELGVSRPTLHDLITKYGLNP